MPLSNEAIQGLLAFGAGTLANNTGNYGLFGPAVGKGGLLGLQQYGDAQRTSLFAKRQESDENFRKFQMDDTTAVRKMEQDKLRLQQENQRLIMERLAQLSGGYQSQQTAPQVGPMASQVPLAPFSQDSIRASLAMGGGPTREAENVLLQSGIREQSDLTTPPVDPEGKNWRDPQSFADAARDLLGLDPQIAQGLMSQATFYQNAIKEEEAAKDREFTNARGRLTPVTGLPGIFVDNDSDKHFARVRNKDGMLDWQELTSDEVAAMDTALANARSDKTIVNAYEPAVEQIQKEQAKELRESYNKYKDIGPTLKNLEKARELVPQARGFVGSFGEWKLSAIKFLNNNLGTNIAPSQVQSAEALRTALFQQILDNLRRLDASPSQQQQMVMQQAMGTIGSDPDAIPAIIDVYEDILRGKAEVHNEAVRGIDPAVRKKFLFDLEIKVPEDRRQKRVINWEDM